LLKAPGHVSGAVFLQQKLMQSVRAEAAWRLGGGRAEGEGRRVATELHRPDICAFSIRFSVLTLFLLLICNGQKKSSN
jgi:hypothetical protein